MITDEEFKNTCAVVDGGEKKLHSAAKRICEIRGLRIDGPEYNDVLTEVARKMQLDTVISRLDWM